MQRAASKLSRITRPRIADGRFSVQAFGPYLDGIVEHRSGPAVVLTMGRISDCRPGVMGRPHSVPEPGLRGPLPVNSGMVSAVDRRARGAWTPSRARL